MQHHLVRLVRFPGPWFRNTAVIFACLALGATLSWASVHTRLESSVPAANQVLTTAPESFELRFSAPVNGALSTLLLVTPAGDSVQVELRTAGDDGRTLVGSVPKLADGEYVVLWRTVSADGHPVSGEFGFSFVDEQAGEAVASPPTDETRATETESPSSDAGPPAWIVALAGVGMVCLLGFAGILWYCGSLPLWQEPRIGGATVALGWTSLLLLSGHYLAWTLSVLPPGTGLAGFAAALGSSTGMAGLARLILVGGAVLALPRNGRAAAALALTAVVVGGISGHTVTISPWITMPAKIVHLGAASVWLGGLLLLVLAPNAPTDGSDVWEFGGVLRAVSGAALLSVILITASGLVQSAQFVGDFAAYAGTPYGRGVLGKWAGLIVLVGFGALHRFRLIPKFERDGDTRGLRRTVRLETIILLAVVLLAAWLARVSPPAVH